MSRPQAIKFLNTNTNYACLHFKKHRGLHVANVNSPVTRQRVFGIYDQVRLKPACAATEAWNFLYRN